MEKMWIKDNPCFGETTLFGCCKCEEQEPTEQEESKPIEEYYSARHAIRCGWRVVVLFNTENTDWICSSCANKLYIEMSLGELANDTNTKNN